MILVTVADWQCFLWRKFIIKLVNHEKFNIKYVSDSSFVLYYITCSFCHFCVDRL